MLLPPSSLGVVGWEVWEADGALLLLVLYAFLSPYFDNLKTNEISSNHVSLPPTPHGVLSQDIVPAQQQSPAASPQRVQAPRTQPSPACNHLYAPHIQDARQAPLLAQVDGVRGEVPLAGVEAVGAALEPTAGIRSLPAMARPD